jgi:hypothetical protein
MKKNEGFEFIPKKWLGDAHIMSMDWDCRGMHLHLIAVSWQKEPQGYLIDDDELIQKLLSNPDKKDWETRIKPQIFAAWEKTVVLENNIERVYWVQPGILDTKAKKDLMLSNNTEKPVTPPRKRKSKAAPLIEMENSPYDGFSLSSLAKMNPKTTILFTPSTTEQSTTIWTIGAQYLIAHGIEEKNSRGLLAKWIKKYGSPEVAKVIAQLSLNNYQPADVVSYVTKILETTTTIKQPKKATVAL